MMRPYDYDPREYQGRNRGDRKSTRLNSSHLVISYAVFCLKKKSTHLNSSHLVISYAVLCLKQQNSYYDTLVDIDVLPSLGSVVNLPMLMRHQQMACMQRRA